VIEIGIRTVYKATAKIYIWSSFWVYTTESAVYTYRCCRR